MGYLIYEKFMIGGFLICFIFGLPVKFDPSVRLSGTYYSVIRFLFIQSSSFSLMYPSLKKEPKAFHCLQSVFGLEAFVLAGFVDQI